MDSIILMLQLVCVITVIMNETSLYLRCLLKQLGLLNKNRKYHLINFYCLKQQGVLFLLPESREKLDLGLFQCSQHLKSDFFFVVVVKLEQREKEKKLCTHFFAELKGNGLGFRRMIGRFLIQGLSYTCQSILDVSWARSNAMKY